MRVLHRDGTDTTVLADEVVVADAIHRKLRGLMFRPPLGDGEAFVLRFPRAKTRSVHTLFVRAPIDVLWVADEQVQRADTLPPWTVRRAGTADTIVELPAGAATEVAVGDHVRLAS